MPEAWRMLLEAHLRYRSGRPQEALDAAEAARARATDDRAFRAAALIAVRSRRLLGDLDVAEAGARQLYGETPPDAPAIDRLRPASLLLSILTDRARVGPEVEELRSVCDRSLDGLPPRDGMQIATMLGNLAFQRGDFVGARHYLEVAVTAAAKGYDPVNLAISQMNLAGVYFEEGRTAECEDLNRQALQSCLSSGMEAQAAHAQRNLATVLLATGRLGEALDLCRKARSGLGGDLFSPNVLAAVAVECEILLEAGLLESARLLMEQTTGLLRKNPVPTVGTVIWRDMGRLERWAGRPESAAELLAEARSQAREAGASDDEGRALLDLAALRIATGDRPAASRILDEAVPIVSASTSAELALRHAFASAMRLGTGNPEEAARLIDEAAGRAARAHLKGWLWRCHAASAGIARSTGRSEDALQTIYAARRALLDLLNGIGPDAMRESYVMLCDTRLFLAWCDGEVGTLEDLPRGGSDLEVFLR